MSGALAFALMLASAARAEEKPRLAVMDLAAKSGIEQNQLDVLGDMRSGPSLIAAPFVPPSGGAGMRVGLRF